MSRQPRGQGASAPSTSRQNEYFVPRDGIDREVISADICRYLGNDALVRPGQYEVRLDFITASDYAVAAPALNPQTGQVVQGYYITGYRNLTTAMIEDLKADSARWDAERRAQTSRNTPGGQYRMSETHQSRQNRGPTEGHYPPDGYGHDGPRYPGTGAPGYTGASPSYAQPGYGGPGGAYGYQQSPPPDPRYSGSYSQGGQPPMDGFDDRAYIHTGANLNRTGAPPQPTYVTAPPMQPGYQSAPYNYQSQVPTTNGPSYSSMQAPDSSFSRVSPATQVPPAGYSQGQYAEVSSGRASVAPPSAPTPSNSSSKRRSDRDDDRHTPSDRHHRQPRR
ncbi:unnamed protein product [Clonostachys chloroleuca]|uniref:Transcription factor RfeG n=1 Tax=Clonostachys chloroleuca TaxID=1926264 RepID=A0AA35LYZ2_9HYPO|nr:unnamed protein product [Clonostachys chloroleuca]